MTNRIGQRLAATARGARGRWQALLVLMLAAMLVACEAEPEFRNRDIKGAMPELSFELQRAASGKKVTADAFDGQVVALFFGYTHCPDYCPQTMSKYAAALDGIDDSIADDMRILFITVDPERDSPERLARYVGGFGDRFVGLWGERPTLREVTKRYRTTFSHEKPDSKGNYEVSHGTASFVFDRSGEIRLLVRDDVPVADLEHDLRILLED